MVVNFVRIPNPLETGRPLCKRRDGRDAVYRCPGGTVPWQYARTTSIRDFVDPTFKRCLTFATESKPAMLQWGISDDTSENAVQLDRSGCLRDFYGALG